MSDHPENTRFASVANTRSAKAQFAYDEGRANAKVGLGSNQNPFLIDLETEQHLAWQEGYGSYVKP